MNLEEESVPVGLCPPLPRLNVDVVAEAPLAAGAGNDKEAARWRGWQDDRGRERLCP